MKITEKMTKAAYIYAKKVYEKDITKDEALDILENKYGMNRNSGADYINNFKCMVEGARYTRTNNAYATELFLSNILSDYGKQTLAKALSAVEQHLNYYESLRSTVLHGIRTIYENYSSILRNSIGTLYPDEIDKPEKLNEGTKKQIIVNAYERNPKARQECINHYGVDCFVCGFNFKKNYGEIGADMIHVHHLIELSNIGEEYTINPIDDLRPVCPNCHAMLHRKKPPYSIEELRVLIKTPNKLCRKGDYNSICSSKRNGLK